MIALTMFYNHVIRYINKLAFLRSSDIRKETDKGRGIPNKIANISVTKNSKRAEMCIK